MGNVADGWFFQRVFHTRVPGTTEAYLARQLPPRNKRRYLAWSVLPGFRLSRNALGIPWRLPLQEELRLGPGVSQEECG